MMQLIPMTEKNLEVQEQKLDLKTFMLMVIFNLLFANWACLASSQAS